MTANQFRKLALRFPESVEGAHMNHPDFRVRGKIFATLSQTDEDWGMVKLTAGQQQAYLRAEPKTFQPAKGAWGAQGCTMVRLRAATKGVVWPALVDAWRNTAPQPLAEQFEDE